MLPPPGLTGPTVAIVGSAEYRPAYDPPVRSPEQAQKAAEELGRELARRGCRIVVFSARERYIEHQVVRGYVSTGHAGLRSVEVHGRFGRDEMDFFEADEHRDVFDVRPGAATDWEAAFYRQLLGVDVVLLLGGGRSTFVAGLIAASRKVPVVPIPIFGGGAEKVWRHLAAEGDEAYLTDSAALARPWREDSAAGVLDVLLGLHHRYLERISMVEAAGGSRRRRASLGLLLALALLIATIVTIPLSHLSTPGTALATAILVLAPLLAATCGAVIRNAVDGTANLMRTAVLGATAGTVTFLLFVAAQLTTSPELLDGSGARRLLFFVIPIAFSAGLTFDAVYRKLGSDGTLSTPPLDTASPEAEVPGE